MRATHLFSRGLQAVLDLLAPPRCAACDRPDPEPSGFCSSCKTPKPAPPGEVAGIPVLAAGLYEASLVPALRAFKYGGRPELASVLGKLIRSRLADLTLRAGDAFVPVPLHASRLAERGYNQSALLARELCHGTPTRSLPRLLVRASATERQANLKRSQRIDNVRGAFSVRGTVRAGRLILVDDVVTTGATARACVEALTASGLSVVAIVAVARSLPGSSA